MKALRPSRGISHSAHRRHTSWSGWATLPTMGDRACARGCRVVARGVQGAHAADTAVCHSACRHTPPALHSLWYNTDAPEAWRPWGSLNRRSCSRRTMLFRSPATG